MHFARIHRAQAVMAPFVEVSLAARADPHDSARSGVSENRMRASASWGFGSCDIGDSRHTPSRTAPVCAAVRAAVWADAGYLTIYRFKIHTCRT